MLSGDRLRSVFAHQLKQTETLLSLAKIPTLFVDYNRTIENPEETATRLKSFLGGDINEEGVTEAVDPSLKRQGWAGG